MCTYSAMLQRETDNGAPCCDVTAAAAARATSTGGSGSQGETTRASCGAGCHANNGDVRRRSSSYQQVLPPSKRLAISQSVYDLPTQPCTPTRTHPPVHLPHLSDRVCTCHPVMQLHSARHLTVMHVPSVWRIVCRPKTVFPAGAVNSGSSQTRRHWGS